MDRHAARVEHVEALDFALLVEVDVELRRVECPEVRDPAILVLLDLDRRPPNSDQIAEYRKLELTPCVLGWAEACNLGGPSAWLAGGLGWIDIADLDLHRTREVDDRVEGGASRRGPHHDLAHALRGDQPGDMLPPASGRGWPYSGGAPMI